MRRADVIVQKSNQESSKLEINTMKDRDYKQKNDFAYTRHDDQLNVIQKSLTDLSNSFSRSQGRPGLTESDPVLQRALTGVKNSIRDIRETGERTRDQVMTLERSGSVVRGNLSRLAGEQAAMFGYFEEVNAKQAEFVDALDDLAEQDRTRKNEVSLVDMRVTAQVRVVGCHLRCAVWMKLQKS